MASRLRTIRTLILHRTPVREKDRIIDVFSWEEGRVHLFAPGVRHVTSRRAGHLEPLMESRLTVSRSHSGNAVSDARVLHAFPRLREHLDRLDIAYDIAKLLRRHTIEGMIDRQLYDATLAVFHALDDRRSLLPLLYEGVIVRLLASHGALPDLLRCTRCRSSLRSRAFGFPGGQRGFVCVSCGAQSDPPLTDVVKLLRLLLHHPVLARGLNIPETIEQRTRSLVQSLLRSHARSAGVHPEYQRPGTPH